MSNSPQGLDVGLREAVDALRAEVARFVSAEIAPRAAEIDARNNAWLQDLRATLYAGLFPFLLGDTLKLLLAAASLRLLHRAAVAPHHHPRG
jgi:hypothetical protein